MYIKQAKNTRKGTQEFQQFIKLTQVLVTVMTIAMEMKAPATASL